MLGATRPARLARCILTAVAVLGGVAACEPWRDDDVAMGSRQPAPMIVSAAPPAPDLPKPPPTALLPVKSRPVPSRT